MPTAQDWERVIYHEAGHAVAALHFNQAASPIVVRCIDRNGVLEPQGSFGRLNPPLGPNYPQLLQECIRIAAAARITEEVKFGNVGPGVAHDMSQVDLLSNTLRDFSERDSGFSDTRVLIASQWDKLVRIATIGIRRFLRLGLPEAPFPNTVVLSSSAVQRIFSGPELVGTEITHAKEVAYLRHVSRGGPPFQPYDPVIAEEDFVIAAGDLLSEIA